MVIDNEDLALHTLQHYNYYRLGAYWLPFESDHNSHKFKPGINFEAVLKLYNFDRLLRLMILDAIERIEVSIRGQWAYHMGHLHGAHAHLNSNLANNRDHWQKNKDILKKEVLRSDEVFIRHLTAKYEEELPPIWAACEVMSLGLLSRWYKNLKPMNTRRLIANQYNLDESVLESWLHHISILRNVCAHHSRLWNRDFSRVRPMHTRNKPVILKEQFVSSPKIYNSFIILLHLIDKTVQSDTWRENLKYLLLDNKGWLFDMGFPEGWEEENIWLKKII